MNFGVVKFLQLNSTYRRLVAFPSLTIAIYFCPMRWMALLLLLAVVPKLFYKSGALVAFESNRAYMAEAFCINKDKPELACNGQCHLAEMLAEDEPATPDAPVVPPQIELIWSLPQDFLKIQHLAPITNPIEHFCAYIFFPVDPIFSIPVPPPRFC